MARNPAVWLGRFSVARPSRGAGAAPCYVLVGALTDVHKGREVRLVVDRERLQSMVVNLAADGDLFPHTSEGVEGVNRLRLLVQLGVPEAMARDITGVYP